MKFQDTGKTGYDAQLMINDENSRGLDDSVSTSSGFTTDWPETWKAAQKCKSKTSGLDRSLRF